MRYVLNERYESRAVEWFAEEVERYTWPVFVTKQSSAMLAANRAARKLLGMPLTDNLPQPKWSFLARASDPAYAARVDNWDDVMSFMLGILKGEQRYEGNLERMPPPVIEPFQQFLGGDPAYITRLLKLWETADPIEISTRMTGPVRWWLESGELLSFTGTMHVADLWQELAWLDWVPTDAATWAGLAKL